VGFFDNVELMPLVGKRQRVVVFGAYGLRCIELRWPSVSALEIRYDKDGSVGTVKDSATLQVAGADRTIRVVRIPQAFAWSGYHSIPPGRESSCAS
jgi:hypothetical protein